jgi:nitrate/nitrite transporter NarK
LGAAGLAYGLIVTVAMARWVDDAITAPNREAAERHSGPLIERVRAELRTLVAAPGIIALAGLTVFATTASWGITSYLVVFLTDVYGISLGIANLTLSALFVLGAGAVLVGGALTDRFGGGRVLIAVYSGVTVLVGLVTAQIVPALLAVGLFLVIGIVRSMGGPARDELTERLATGGTTGTAFAIVTVGLMLGSTIAPAAFGYITDVAGVRAAFVGITIVALAAAIISILVVLRYAGVPREGVRSE